MRIASLEEPVRFLFLRCLVALAVFSGAGSTQPSVQTSLGSPLPCLLHGQQEGAQRVELLSRGWASPCPAAAVKGYDRCLLGQSLVSRAFTKDNRVTDTGCF